MLEICNFLLFLPQRYILRDMEELPRPSQIPGNWNFYEKELLGEEKSGIQVVQIEYDFLAIKGKLSEKEYFFNSEGDIVSGRSVRYSSKLPKFFGSEIVIDNQGREIPSGFIASDIQTDDSEITFSFLEVKKDKDPYLPNALVHFKSGKLTAIALSKNFIIDRQDNVIKSPKVYVSFSEDREPVISISPNSSNDDFTTVYEGKPGEMKVVNAERELVYQIDLKQTAKGWTLKQVHIPTEIEKIFEAPLNLDLESIRKAVLVRPPYDKKSSVLKGAPPVLDVSWRKINEIIGISLAYSYPDSRQPKSEV